MMRSSTPHRSSTSLAGTITTGEIKATLGETARGVRHVELADPWRWSDLAAQPDRTAAIVRGRLLAGRSPATIQAFPWPKDRRDFRAMAWLDPFDQLAYRAMVGRHVGPVTASVDAGVVLSCRLDKHPPRWRLKPYQEAINERRERASALLATHGVLATIDIENYFPSVSREALRAVLGALPVHPPSFNCLLDWLDALHATSEVSGLPVGLEGSEVLGNALLAPGDRLLTSLGVPFMRYMDDTWLFLRHETLFAGVLHAYKEVVSTAPMGLVCHPTKTTVLDPLTAIETIERSVIQYAEADLVDAESDDCSTALALLDYALAEPDGRRPELRKALKLLKDRGEPAAFDALTSDVSLIALAPGHWRGYLRRMVADKKLRKRTGADDWVLEQVTTPVTSADAYTAVVLLQVAAGLVMPNVADGSRLLDAAQRTAPWAEPLQVGAVHLWGSSQAFKPGLAVEAAEAAPTVASKRAYALTLASRRDHKKLPTWVDGIRRCHPDLDATAAWLEAA